ncbi:MAG: class I SAM-dependent rRNA methyltransferase [Candidatus Hydrogenedentes bacterium]|nr:class I SAM-dependent rRNA methyltransferase [Candidatus Hydrogenedentota bacterium]
METAILKSKEDRRLLRGHLWAYRNEFAKLPRVSDGEVVDIQSDRGRFIGRGFYQSEGGIGVRILTRRDNETVDAAFLARRVARAKRYRDRLYPGENVYRWVYGESDGLPGLVVDRYGPVVVAQSSCQFYAQYAEILAKAFQEHEGVTGVKLTLPGVDKRVGEVPDAMEVSIGGLQFTVNLAEGQKTGIFLDQRENCWALRPLAHGAKVLDGHCYAGQWSCHFAAAGAASVLGVDTSAPAIERARANAERNGVADRCVFESASIAEVLQRGERYDVVLLDPPALAKTRAQATKAAGLYQALNRDALLAVEPGGYLVTSSCSHFVDKADFVEILKRAARAAQRDAWVVEERGAAKDHPILLAMPETEYLKCVVLRVF